MKIRLLKDLYIGMEGVKLPVEVEAEPGAYSNALVHEDELARIGCDMDVLTYPDNPTWPFGPESWEAVE